jgi:hypothetical protein
MDDSAVSANGDGRTIGSAQAVDASKDFGWWTLWTAFGPSILRLRHYAQRIETQFLGCSVCAVRYY